MSMRPLTLALTAVLLTVGVTRGQQQQTPPPKPPATTPAPPPQGRGGFGIEAEIARGANFDPQPPIVRLDPKEQQKRFLLPPGFAIEPVMSDPLIQDPVGVTFDGNGRMYVLEMRSYMRDADGTNSREPISRISRHEDTNGDGVYDKHTVFADKLVLPRMAFPLQDGVILVLETDNRDLMRYTDTNGDGVADKKEVVYTPFGRVTNMEWQPGGMTWALDNWLYTTYNPFRLRLTPAGTVIREDMETPGGQWWSAQDNYGKMWYVDGGAEIGPVNFQVPIAYGAINVNDNFEPEFQTPWPASPGIADMQGGMQRVRTPDGTLNHFTAASGVEIYRGHRMPADFTGDLFFAEPVGRMIRRAKVIVTEGLTQLRNAYPKSEFIRSSDPLFRPVNVTAAPDGSLLVIDMYTGIIQDAQFVGQGSYLRRKIDQYQLDKQHNWGRIWRVTHKGTSPDRRQPRMYSESAAALVRHLEHPHGWWRDTAQKLLVLRQDKSVVPALTTMARSSSNQLARIHALWTLEGLDALDAALARELMKSPDPQIRVQAIRASETIYKSGLASLLGTPAAKGDKTFADDYRALAKDPAHDVAIQALLTLNAHRVEGYASVIESTMAASTARGIKEIGAQLLKPRASRGQPAAFADPALAGTLGLPLEQRRMMQRGAGIYTELCASCHGPDGKGTPMAGAAEGTTLAPALAGSARVAGHRDYIIKVLLHGLTGELDGKSYPGGVMVPMGGNTDEWISDVASYVRNSFGNNAFFVMPEHVAAVRKANPRTSMWSFAELASTTPMPLTNQSDWKASASHNNENAANGINGSGTTRWTTNARQEPGMWFQIELPQPTTIAEIIVDASMGGGFAGFGGRGTGGMPALGMSAYRLQVSMDGTTWGDPIAEGQGQPTNPTTVMSFAPVQAKFVRITQTQSVQFNVGWAIQRVRIFAIQK
jgi:glucose/arabinose dehydrogenase/mono/diheme cytochrome c family protein